MYREDAVLKQQPRAAVDQVDTDVDRYPNIYDVLVKLQHDANLPNEPIERIEVTALASGECTYRYWLARAEEPEGGYWPEI